MKSLGRGCRVDLENDPWTCSELRELELQEDFLQKTKRQRAKIQQLKLQHEALLCRYQRKEAECQVLRQDNQRLAMLKELPLQIQEQVSRRIKLEALLAQQSKKHQQQVQKLLVSLSQLKLASEQQLFMMGEQNRALYIKLRKVLNHVDCLEEQAALRQKDHNKHEQKKDQQLKALGEEVMLIKKQVSSLKEALHNQENHRQITLRRANQLQQNKMFLTNELLRLDAVCVQLSNQKQALLIALENLEHASNTEVCQVVKQASDKYEDNKRLQQAMQQQKQQSQRQVKQLSKKMQRCKQQMNQLQKQLKKQVSEKQCLMQSLKRLAAEAQVVGQDNMRLRVELERAFSMLREAREDRREKDDLQRKRRNLHGERMEESLRFEKLLQGIGAKRL